MEITEKLINKLLGIINGGLCHGAGSMTITGSFCVQQAVTEATGEGCSDRPECVDPEVRGLGICLNDAIAKSRQERARILKRFAVAELGSYEHIYVPDFIRLMMKNWNTTYPSRPIRGYGELMVTNNDVEAIAEMAVQALIELGSPGTKYLYMCGDTREGDPQPNIVTRAKHKVEKALVATIEKKQKDGYNVTSRLRPPDQMKWRDNKPGHHAHGKEIQ